jgi:ABC-type branched-subunit amino acid transport system ATPase component
VAVLLIEHDMSLVMGISDRILVMEHGKPIVTGTPGTGAQRRARDQGLPGRRMMQFDKVHTHYGAIEALHGVSLKVEKGEIVT